jgi:hypothetical protein
MIFILCGAAGLRIGEALGIEINKHVPPDFLTISIKQEVPAVVPNVLKKLQRKRQRKQLKEREKRWSGREDLNLRPPGPEPGALPG